MSNRLQRFGGVLLGVQALLSSWSCSSSIEPGSNAAILTFSMTDQSAQRFTSFAVDVTRLELRNTAGDPVTIFSEARHIDLASVAETSQVLALASLPPAEFEALAVTIDFTNAHCLLVGQSVPASILDGDGNPRSGSVTYDVEVSDPIEAVIGRNQSVEIDLGSARTMEVNATDNEVRFEPAVAVRVDRFDSKPLVLDGTLLAADALGGFLQMALMTSAGFPVGSITATVPTETVVQLDENLLVGVDGLAALAASSPGAPMHMIGSVDPFLRRILAAHVDVGTSTSNGGLDLVEGQIIGRVGGTGEDATLTVLGKGESAELGVTLVNSTFTVSTSFADTKVSRPGLGTPLDTDDLNIGQSVRVLGSLSGTQMDASRPSDIVSVLPTRVFGFAAGGVGNEIDNTFKLTIDLERVGATAQEEFAWSEGGSTPPNPDAFTIEVSFEALFLLLAAGHRVECFGTFEGVDDELQDFVADETFNREESFLMIVRDRPGGLVVTPTIAVGNLPTTPTSITLLLEGTLGAGEVAKLDLGFAGSQELPLDPPPKILVLEVPLDQIGTVPDELEVRHFVITHRRDGSCFAFRQFKRTNAIEDEFTQFQLFADRLVTELARGARIYDIEVVGEYVADDNRLDALLVSVVLD